MRDGEQSEDCQPLRDATALASFGSEITVTTAAEPSRSGCVPMSICTDCIQLHDWKRPFTICFQLPLLQDDVDDQKSCLQGISQLADDQHIPH